MSQVATPRWRQWAAALACSWLGAVSTAQAYTEGYLAPNQGWKLLQPDFDGNHWLDPISLEWDYWMIHADTWNGMVAYLLANPRRQAPALDWALLPNGQNMAVVGQLPGQRPVANYVNFGYVDPGVNGLVRSMKAILPDGQFADYSWTKLPNGELAARLKGRSTDWEWDFTVTQDMKDRDRVRASSGAFMSVYGRDMDLLPGSEWNVDEVWPRTNVVGSVTARASGQVVAVQGKGYREDGWGRYAIPLDGWDFMVFGEVDGQGAFGVLQTYHQSKRLDALDVSFIDQGQPVSIRFQADQGELGWKHPLWKWDAEARSCVPTHTVVQARKGGYEVELKAEIGHNQRALLTRQTVGSSIMFIAEHFPTVTGVIRRSDGTEVRRFTTRGGGEFAKTKDVALWRSDLSCTLEGQFTFNHPMPR